MDYNATQENSYISGITQTDGKINVSYTVFPNIYNAETQFSYGEEQSQTTMTIPNLFITVYNLNKTINDLNGKINTLEFQLTNANNQITDLNKAITTLTERVNALESPTEETPPVEEGGQETPTE